MVKKTKTGCFHNAICGIVYQNSCNYNRLEVKRMKRIALINDLSGFGKCSLTAAIPVISVMGIQACPLPTAILSAQTGFDKYFCDDYTDKMDVFTEYWNHMEVSFDGIYSGYLASPSQLARVLHFLDLFRGADTLYLADPVMGDGGRRYSIFNEEFLQGMKKLTTLADVITPNLTELCLLADEDYDEVNSHCGERDYLTYLQEICRRLLGRAQRPQTIIVTGILREIQSENETICMIGNLAVSDRELFYTENPYTGIGFSGTGDLFASVICGACVKGVPMKEAVESATEFLREAIVEATEKGIPRNHGVPFEKYLHKLL